VPLDGVIAELSAQETRGIQDPLEKARAIYNYVIATMRYDKSGTGWGNGDAIWACTAKRGNCTDFHSLFIGMMRAAAIPARFEIGFPLPADQHDGAVAGYHCWAQFYVEPYGWIPVDASEAWKHPEKKNYFFGAHDDNRLQFTVGRDIRLDPPQRGDPLNYFIYPYAELDALRALSRSERKRLSNMRYSYCPSAREGAAEGKISSENVSVPKLGLRVMRTLARMASPLVCPTRSESRSKRWLAWLWTF
jgi:transglutaminase-like putative cysteine protease